MRNLKKFRGMRGMSQVELAKKVGVTRALIIYLEKDENSTTSEKTTEKLCSVLNITPCELYGVDNLRFEPQDKADFEAFIDVLKKEYDNKWDS